MGQQFETSLEIHLHLDMTSNKGYKQNCRYDHNNSNRITTLRKDVNLDAVFMILCSVNIISVLYHVMGF